MAENVKVAVRVRPFNSREKERSSQLCIKMQGNSTYITDPSDAKGEPRKFAFDYSYWSHDGFKEEPNGYLSPTSSQYADQAIVFKDLGEGVLANAWEGYNCSLFAYGQTGSGKSYSMVGYGMNKGIVPITCERLFEEIDKKKNGGSKTEYQVTLSMLEIYNEQVRDLLNPATLKIKGGMKVRQNPKTGFYVDGLSQVPVGSYVDIDGKIEQGTKNRTVASTNMNATSSRAHTIVAINFSQKGKNEATGQNTTKTSVINLVDLAGSERADSTGATGDRLKEGSAINKSLSSLGNVIKALADQSMGKTKVTVPFRDSVLTKLLKNALGGNSKTIMIAALSPADINYDETLSTLRFADRAKAIKTKAVVNESPTDKLIRELREENARLMEQLKAAKGDPKAMAAIMAAHSGEAPPAEDDGKKMVDEEKVEAMRKEMEDKMQRNQKELEEMKKSWQQRLKEEQDASKVKEEELKKEHEMKKTTSHLWNLNEDPQLTNMINHFLKPGKYRIGNKKANPLPDIVLNGLSVLPDHCQIEHDGKSHKISVVPSSNAKILLNGVNLVEARELHHNDRIMFGNNHLFGLHHPNDPELLKKKAEAKKQGKVYDDSPPSFEQAQEEIAQNSGLLNYASATDGKDGKKSKEDLLLQGDLLQLLPMINEANAISEELDKKVVFEPILISPQARGEKDGRTIVQVKMKDLRNDNEFIWDKNKFVNRKFIMQEMYNDFSNGEDWEKPKEEDPFWEDPDTDVQIGFVQLFLQGLAYKIELEENLEIIDHKGESKGRLQVKLLPCEKNGQEIDEDDFVDDPKHLIGKPYHFKVMIDGARGLPKRFSKGETYCSYTFYTCDKEKTKRVKDANNPDYKHTKMFSFNIATQALVDHLHNEHLKIELWGKQGGAVNPKAKNLSTKQLMNQDKNKRGRLVQSTSSRQDDERYKMLCDVNTYKRRADRMASKMDRVRKLVENSKGTIKVEDLDAILKGSDKSDMQRFHAAADVVLQGEKLKSNKAKGANAQSSKACIVQ